MDVRSHCMYYRVTIKAESMLLPDILLNKSDFRNDFWKNQTTQIEPQGYMITMQTYRNQALKKAETCLPVSACTGA